MQEWEIEQAAHRFALLSDPTRLRILHALLELGELPVHSIAKASGVARSNTSAHLSRLAEGGLVARRRAASTVYYRIDDQNLPAICEWVCDSLHRRAAGLLSR